MKFQVERDVLAEAVAWAARTLPTRPAQPMLAGLLIEKKGKLSVFVLFTGKELPDYETVYETTGTVIKKLIHAVKQKAV